MVMDKGIMKELAIHLGNYSQYKDAIKDIEEELINNSRVDINSHLKSKNKISKTVEDTAIKIAEDRRINYYNKWIKAIDWLVEEIKSEPIKTKILELKYLDKVQKVTDTSVINELIICGYMSSDDWKYYIKTKEQILYKLEQKARDYNLI